MSNRLHFHSLDALRFFAFLKVYLLHVPLQGYFPVFGYLKRGGGIGVAFFFVLSGFLITYLLVHDKMSRGQVNLRNFFLRRSFRIWPLFYLMVLLAFLLPYAWADEIGFHMVGGGYLPDWKYSFTFTENYKMLIEDNFPRTTPLPVFWSLCIEEHFYIVWMLAMFLLPLKHVLKFLLACFAVAWISRYAEPYIFHNQNISTNDLLTNIDYFAAGGLLGYAVARHYERLSAAIQAIPLWLRYLYIVFAVAVVIFQVDLLFFENNFRFDVVRHTFIALLFAGLVAVFIPQNGLRIKSRLLAWLGSISYGLYVFHIIFIHMVFQYCLRHQIVLDDTFRVTVFIIVTFGLTVLAGALSYRFIERPFLRLRERFK